MDVFTEKEFSIKGRSIGTTISKPTTSAFNNCHGGWTEFIFASYVWNILAGINKVAYENGGVIYVKLPDNKDSKIKWTAALDKKHAKVIKAFDRNDGNDEEVKVSGHKAFLLNSSNPDVAIFKYPKNEFDKILDQLPINPREKIADLSLATQDGLDRVFKSLEGTVAPRRNLHCFLSVKNSVRPDRRLQYLHEGNNVKTILLYLINERNSCDSLLKYDILHNMYYAVIFSEANKKDRECLDAAMVACLTSPSLPKTWAVDELFVCKEYSEVVKMLSIIIPECK